MVISWMSFPVLWRILHAWYNMETNAFDAFSKIYPVFYRRREKQHIPGVDMHDVLGEWYLRYFQDVETTFWNVQCKMSSSFCLK